ncbi:MAG: nitroreductase family deazaflavin-dependent oxidoreductase [Anaerolineales bacterium]|nr:nitroreductase family deazaflavin-dependent oxidoreductase [Anaerolineales bacterium]MCA9927566.1 nitroreductase family deazaflavin-dependent oxidoreductase [Anaerolineales bacterium]
MTNYNVSEDTLRQIFKRFNRFMLILWRFGLGSWGNGTQYGGYIMVIKHIGRKTGLVRHTPVNYAEINGDIYCTAGFGRISDWYRNMQANPQVEVWLPNGRWAGIAEDVTRMEGRASIFRQVIIASGFAGPLFGVNQKKLSDTEMERFLEDYRLVRIRRTEALTGPGGPGDLAWVWPISTMVLLWLLWRKKGNLHHESSD